MGVVTGRYSVVQVDPATAESRQPKWPATGQQLQRHITFCDCLPAEHMSAGGEEFETPPPSPNYSPQPSDDEDEENISVAGDGEDEEDMDVANDDAGEVGWWADEAFTQREQESVQNVAFVSLRRHIRSSRARCPKIFAQHSRPYCNTQNSSRWVTGICLRVMCTLTLGL